MGVSIVFSARLGYASGDRTDAVLDTEFGWARAPQLSGDLAVTQDLALATGLGRSHNFLWRLAQHLQHDEDEQPEGDVPGQRRGDQALAGSPAG